MRGNRRRDPVPALCGAVFAAAFAIVAFVPAARLLLADMAVSGLFAMSLSLILSLAGIVSLGHAAFFGTGAYAAGLLAVHVAGDPLAGLAAGSSMAALLGLATALPVVRGADLTRLVLTLAVSMLVLEGANRFSGLTGGSDGLQGIVMAPLLGVFAFDLGGRTAAVYSLAVLMACLLAVHRLVGSPFGLSLQAIRSEPLRARALGVPATARLVGVYVLAAAMAGLAGALGAQVSQFASLDGLEVHRSAEALLAVALAGRAGPVGTVACAAALVLLQDRLSILTPQYWELWLGAVLVLVVLAPVPARSLGLRWRDRRSAGRGSPS